MSNINYTSAFASDQTTVSNTALTLVDFGFSADEVLTANRMVLMVNSNSIRVWWDGTVPTTSNGMILSVGIELVGENLRNFQMIRNDATDSEVAIILET